MGIFAGRAEIANGGCQMTEPLIHDGYNDPDSEYNGSKYHTGKLCIEGCGRKAGTAWSPHWCFECNVKRIDRISEQLEKMLSKESSS